MDAARIDAHTVVAAPDSVVNGRLAPQWRHWAGRAPAHEVSIAADPAGLTVVVGAIPVSVTLNGRRRWGRKDEGAGPAPGRSGSSRRCPARSCACSSRRATSSPRVSRSVVVEAMKMENELRASRDGTVTEIHVREGMSVDAGALLLVIQ